MNLNFPKLAFVLGLMACLSLIGCAHHKYDKVAPAGTTSSIQSQLNSHIKGANITVQTVTSHGKAELVLRGTVPSKKRKKQASEYAKKLAPGYRISNKLAVGS